jgi:membrane-bound serine protease (ClpP class)
MLPTIILLVILGIITIGLEFFLPGGILGVLGIGVMVVAIVLCFSHYGSSAGLALSAGVIVTVGVSLTFWLKNFERIGMGKKLMLKEQVNADEVLTKIQELLHQEGVAQTDLRPAGKVQMGTRRVDVVAEHGMIESGEPVKVVKVEGTRVVVRRIQFEASAVS